MKWSELKYWSTGEWQVVHERLTDLKKKGIIVNPSMRNLFLGLRKTPFDTVKVVIMGQDPYPDPKYATGLAFSIPTGVSPFPPTLTNLLKEYQDDLHYPLPSSGNLSPWAERGVLLLNAIHSCSAFHPASHRWGEWEYLTREIVERLDETGKVVFILLGNVAKSYGKYIKNSICITTSHPSPLGSKHGFLGSRIFSRANQSLCSLGIEPIDWRLPYENEGKKTSYEKEKQQPKAMQAL